MNNKNKIYSGILAAFIIASIFSFNACNKKAEGNKTEADEAHKEGEEAAAEGVKEVHLNEAQYKATGLVLAGFEKKNLSEVINTNSLNSLPIGAIVH